MKYMTFNSSCSYCCLANLLERYGISREDRELALDMGLPRLFARREDGTYLAGAMLQGKPWFDRALSPLGFRFEEELLSRPEVPERLEALGSAMVGMAVGQGKHAVVFLGKEGERYRFLNPHRRDDGQADELLLTKDELLERLDEENAVGRIVPGERSLPEDWDSPTALKDYCRDMTDFCGAFRTKEAIFARVNTLFRPFAVDLLAMMELAGEDALTEDLRVFQSQCMALFRAGDCRPAEIVDLELFSRIAEKYEALLK